MKLPPKKPHFFKPILPGFNDGIKIPTSFLKNYLGGESYNPHEALLRRGGKEWRVKINDQFLREGWSRFAMENNLEPGDFVVFEHEENMVFEVLIFGGRSQCEKEDSSMDDQEDVAYTTEARESPPKKSKSEGREEEVPTTEDKKQCSSHLEESDNPYFISTVKQYSIDRSFLYIPIKFATTNGLANRHCNIILKDQQERSWLLDLKPKSSSSCIKCGLTLSKFFTANGYKEGDSFKFELVENGETPVVIILPNFTADPEAPRTVNSQDKGKRVKATPESDDDCPYFTSTVMPYSFRNSVLNVPMKFARSNGLLEKDEMILTDKRQRSWPVGLKQRDHHFCITSGWQKFRKENGLKEGDAFKFEIIKNGKVPLARFTVVPRCSAQPLVGSKRSFQQEDLAEDTATQKREPSDSQSRRNSNKARAKSNTGLRRSARIVSALRSTSLPRPQSSQDQSLKEKEATHDAIALDLPFVKGEVLSAATSVPTRQVSLSKSFSPSDPSLAGLRSELAMAMHTMPVSPASAPVAPKALMSMNIALRSASVLKDHPPTIIYGEQSSFCLHVLNSLINNAPSVQVRGTMTCFINTFDRNCSAYATHKPKVDAYDEWMAKLRGFDSEIKEHVNKIDNLEQEYDHLTEEETALRVKLLKISERRSKINAERGELAVQSQSTLAQFNELRSQQGTRKADYDHSLPIVNDVERAWEQLKAALNAFPTPPE